MTLFPIKFQAVLTILGCSNYSSLNIVQLKKNIEKGGLLIFSLIDPLPSMQKLLASNEALLQQPAPFRLPFLQQNTPLVHIGDTLRSAWSNIRV
jgi:hypothetical protein